MLTSARNCAGNVGLSQLLNTSRQYTVPLFHRKYCWQTSHWNQLWKDLRAVAAKPSHPMGKLAVYEEPGAAPLPTAADDQRAADADELYAQRSAFSSARAGRARAVRVSQLMVLDGQQRLTSCCLLLAALRDAAALIAAAHQPAAESPPTDSPQARAKDLSIVVNRALFHEDEWFCAYRARASTAHKQEGEQDDESAQVLAWLRENATFLPTHDDRTSFAVSILPPDLLPLGLLELPLPLLSTSVCSHDADDQASEGRSAAVEADTTAASSSSLILAAKQFFVGVACQYVGVDLTGRARNTAHQQQCSTQDQDQ
eukprot:COSAG05_NODE_6168_length_1009_cov_2.030769_1_plen_313_part_01